MTRLSRWMPAGVFLVALVLGVIRPPRSAAVVRRAVHARHRDAFLVGDLGGGARHRGAASRLLRPAEALAGRLRHVRLGAAGCPPCSSVPTPAPRCSADGCSESRPGSPPGWRWPRAPTSSPGHRRRAATRSRCCWRRLRHTPSCVPARTARRRGGPSGLPRWRPPAGSASSRSRLRPRTWSRFCCFAPGPRSECLRLQRAPLSPSFFRSWCSSCRGTTGSWTGSRRPRCGTSPSACGTGPAAIRSLRSRHNRRRAALPRGGSSSDPLEGCARRGLAPRAARPRAARLDRPAGVRGALRAGRLPALALAIGAGLASLPQAVGQSRSPLRSRSR